MSAPKFRVGDVVHVAGSREERRVESMTGDGWPNVRCGIVLIAVDPIAATLLRRPVRVGDVIKVMVTGELHTVEASDVRHNACHWPSWTHADGTPIEPPRAELCGEAGAPPKWVGPPQAEPGPEPVAKPTYNTPRNCRDHCVPIEQHETAKALYRDLRAHVSRIADEAGALRSERDELLRENATLRRTIDRLERKRGGR